MTPSATSFISVPITRFPVISHFARSFLIGAISLPAERARILTSWRFAGFPTFFYGLLHLSILHSTGRFWSETGGTAQSHKVPCPATPAFLPRVQVCMYVCNPHGWWLVICQKYGGKSVEILVFLHVPGGGRGGDRQRNLLWQTSGKLGKFYYRTS